jgi:hypothetical protein
MEQTLGKGQKECQGTKECHEVMTVRPGPPVVVPTSRCPGLLQLCWEELSLLSKVARGAVTHRSEL